jgi:two-component system LytT family response regulator
MNSSELRVVLVDDEPLGRERIRSLLARETGVVVIGEASSGVEAVDLITRVRPDLVFLDVQMPGLTGFGVLERLDPAHLPVVIFVTAHDQFALKAFEVHAVDYLLKPFDRDRFKLALQRATDRLKSAQPDDLSARLTAMLAQMQPAQAARAPDRIPVKSSGRVVFVNVVDIDWVGSADNYVELHVGEHTHLLRETLASMEQRLPADRFVRISRTTIVHAERVRELQPLFHGEYAVTLKNGTRLTLSRSHRDQLARLGVR